MPNVAISMGTGDEDFKKASTEDVEWV